MPVIVAWTWQEVDELRQVCHWWQEVEEGRLSVMTTFLLTIIVMVIAVAMIAAAAVWARNDRIRIPDRGRYPSTARLWA
jgi:predicted nucleic acid-binding Zn ribbon protein